jgi:predicted aspartyl protease
MVSVLAAVALVAQSAAVGADIPLEAWTGRKTADYDTRVFAIRASINGGPELRLGLDTNAGAVVLAQSAAEDARIKSGASVSIVWAGTERVRGTLFAGAELRAGSFTADIRSGVVVPDETFHALYQPLDGLIGLDFLSDYVWTVDPKASVLILAPQGSPLPSGEGVVVPFEIDKRLGLHISAVIQGQRQDLCINSGLSDVFVDQELAKQLGLEATGEVRSDAATPYQVGPKTVIELDGLTVPGVQVFVAQSEGWRHLGQSFLNRFIATWDMRAKKVLLRRL